MYGCTQTLSLLRGKDDVGDRQITGRVFTVVSERSYNRAGVLYIRDETRSMPWPAIGQREEKDLISCQIAEQGTVTSNVPG